MLLNDPARLRELHATRLLDSETEPSFDRLTRLAARALRAPVALVSLVDDRRQFFKSCFGQLPDPFGTERGTPLSHSFCQHAVIKREPLIIEDARIHPLVRENLAVPDLGVIAYAGIPLITASGYALGTLCVIDHEPRKWADAELADLVDLAACATTEIGLRLDILDREAAHNALLYAERLKDELLSVVSHELRTPLTSLRGSLGLLASGRLGADQSKRMIELAVGNTDRLIRLINDFLDLERIKSGQFELQKAEIDIADVVASALANVQAEASRTNIEIAAHVEPALVTIDADRMVQVLVNLVSNALKFSPEGSVVTVTAKVDGAELHIGVEDRGRGIPADKIAAVFEPFGQVDATDAREKGGTGLGLPIVRSIVEQHGGRISLASEVGKGTTFRVVLPA